MPCTWQHQARADYEEEVAARTAARRLAAGPVNPEAGPVKSEAGPAHPEAGEAGPSGTSGTGPPQGKKAGAPKKGGSDPKKGGWKGHEGLLADLPQVRARPVPHLPVTEPFILCARSVRSWYSLGVT